MNDEAEITIGGYSVAIGAALLWACETMIGILLNIFR
jgi:hypothetical protein